MDEDKEAGIYLSSPNLIPCVARRVVQFLVFWRLWGKDRRHSQNHGGSVGVSQLVDHNRRQSQAQQLRKHSAQLVWLNSKVALNECFIS